jgi:hypothetical protein
MTDGQSGSWEGFFKLARDIRAAFRVTQMSVNGDAADVVVDGSLSYTNTDLHRQETQPAGFRAQLQRQGEAWVIAVVH